MSETLSGARGGRLILVRHGETNANRNGRYAGTADIPLNEAGHRQSLAVAESLPGRFFPSRVFSSRFLRARQTAGIIAARLGLDVQTVAGIEERNFGCLEGEEYQRMGELMLSDPSYDANRMWMWKPEGGESMDEVRLRATPVLQSLHRDYPGEDLVAVCHGAVIQAVCADFAGGWTDVVIPPNCGVVVIDWSREGADRICP